ncbi:hypothetical protein SAMN05421630_104154 [Prauserella marina]|uniref:Uncharacterized protein n=2 Tax=Prauserella marina TaxID=530584 RepID=A0A1G6PZT9_9PSEU|nr:hypothetical protein DES30_104154 [Prauserella marina]SDC85589.1 hypothetical protein SAMN05421630_104154 [Prauserella marina]
MLGMTGVGDNSPGRAAGRPWLAVGLFLAIGATVALVLAEDLRWLRLGILAALWAALIGAFVATRYRKQAATTQESAAQAQEIYELELEKEIAARREFELEVESETRQRIEEESREEFDALRAEITSLRNNLQTLFGGEVLWERVALTAQSTRMRSLGEEPKLVTASENGNGAKAQLTAGKVVEGDGEAAEDPPTELIGRVIDHVDTPVAEAEPAQRRVPPGRPAKQQEPARTQFVPRPSRPPEDSRPSVRPVQQPVRKGDPPTRRVRPTEHVVNSQARPQGPENRAERSRPQQVPVERPVEISAERLAAERALEQAAERAMADHRPPKATQPPGPVPPPQQPQAAAARRPPERKPQRQEAKPPEQAQVRRPPMANPTRPAMEPPARGRPHPAASAGPPPRKPVAEAPTAYARGADPDWDPATKARPEPVAEPPTRLTPPVSPPQRPQAERQAPPESARSGTHRVPEEPFEQEAVEPNPTLPPAARELQGRSGGRRRKADAEAPADDARNGAASGGRRRKPDGSRHAQPSAEEPATNNGSSGRRAQEQPPLVEEQAGSHAEGRSVSELLAAHGTRSTPSRRRRRAED